MDRIIKKSKGKKRLTTIAAILCIASVATGSFYFSSGSSKFKIEKSKIIISEVKSGVFQEFIPINGIVLPKATIYLDAMEAGRIEEIYIEDGTAVKKDQPILKLSNTDLELSLANQETAVFQVLTQMQNTRNNTEQNTIHQLNQMAEVDNALTEAERIYKLNKTLYDESVIASQEFKASENNYLYQVSRKKLAEQICKKNNISTKQELKQMAETYSRMQHTLALMKRKVKDLVIKSPIDGQLTSLEAQIGQSKNKGERLGQVDIMGAFKIRADIDENYISRVFTGLQAECNIGNKNYKLEVKKVHTEVVKGRFQVDLEFIGESPKDIRRGQSISLRLTLSSETKALLLPKGGFYQQTGGNWIFKIKDASTNAFRSNIKLGRQNPDYYEIIEGLQQGDKVITSSYEDYGNTQQIILKN